MPYSHDETRLLILEMLYKTAENRPEHPYLNRENFLSELNVRARHIDFNIDYLTQNGLIERQRFMGPPKYMVKITDYGIDVIENKKRYVGQYPFLNLNIQEFHGPVYGQAVQIVESHDINIQQISGAFNEARKIISSLADMSEDLKKEALEHLDILEIEVKNKEPDIDTLTRSWRWLKRNARWVVPTLVTIIGLAL